MEKEKAEPPEMAVFSFIDLPDVLTHKKGEHIVNKKEKKRAKNQTSSKISNSEPLDINGNPIDPKRKYLGKKIKIPIASPDCSLYKEHSTIILFGRKLEQMPKQTPRSKFEEFLSRAPISFDNEEEV